MVFRIISGGSADRKPLERVVITVAAQVYACLRPIKYGPILELLSCTVCIEVHGMHHQYASEFHQAM